MEKSQYSRLQLLSLLEAGLPERKVLARVLEIQDREEFSETLYDILRVGLLESKGPGLMKVVRYISKQASCSLEGILSALERLLTKGWTEVGLQHTMQFMVTLLNLKDEDGAPCLDKHGALLQFIARFIAKAIHPTVCKLV